MIIRKEYVLNEDEVKTAILEYITNNVEDVDFESKTSVIIRRVDGSDSCYECIASIEDDDNA